MFRAYGIAFVIGLVLGAGGIGILAWRSNAAQRELIGIYVNAVADRERELAKLNGELAEARALIDRREQLDRARQQLDDEIRGIIRAGERTVADAVGEYNKAIAELRLHQQIYEKLRSYYDPNYKTAKRTSR